MLIFYICKWAVLTTRNCNLATDNVKAALHINGNKTLRWRTEDARQRYAIVFCTIMVALPVCNLRKPNQHNRWLALISVVGLVGDEKACQQYRILSSAGYLLPQMNNVTVAVKTWHLAPDLPNQV